jgi:hypothetical protein
MQITATVAVIAAHHVTTRVMHVVHNTVGHIGILVQTRVPRVRVCDTDLGIDGFRQVVAIQTRGELLADAFEHRDVFVSVVGGVVGVVGIVAAALVGAGAVFDLGTDLFETLQFQTLHTHTHTHDAHQ